MPPTVESHISGPGWTAEVQHVEHTVYAVVYRQDDGHLFRMQFDPREDGTEVYVTLDTWTEPADAAMAESDRPAVVDRLMQALLAYSPKDPWRIWAQAWPRFLLAMANRPETFFIEHSDTWVLYTEVGRSIVIPCTYAPASAAGEKHHITVHAPKEPAWTFPANGGPIPPADWKIIQERLGQMPDADLVWA